MKLIWDRINGQIMESMSKPDSFFRINEVCEQLTYCTDLFQVIMTECPVAFNAGAVSSMLYFAQLAIDNITRNVTQKNRDFPFTFLTLLE